MTRAERTKHNFEEKFGPHAIQTFNNILWETGKLAKAAEYFGFTRANASVLYSRISKIPFSEFKEIRKRKLKEQELKLKEPQQSWASKLGLE